MKCRECDKGVFVEKFGLCKTHYHRLMRRGDTEISRASPDLFGKCTVDGCDRTHKARGLCGSHYAYLKRYGSANPDLKNRGGQVRDPKPSKNKKSGYVFVWDRSIRKMVQQHRIVMRELLGRDLTENETVHHKNGDRADNRVENLELWSKSQPYGQRVEDKVKWAIELLKLYKPEVLA